MDFKRLFMNVIISFVSSFFVYSYLIGDYYESFFSLEKTYFTLLNTFINIIIISITLSHITLRFKLKIMVTFLLLSIIMLLFIKNQWFISEKEFLKAIIENYNISRKITLSMDEKLKRKIRGGYELTENEKKLKIIIDNILEQDEKEVEMRKLLKELSNN